MKWCLLQDRQRLRVLAGRTRRRRSAGSACAAAWRRAPCARRSASPRDRRVARVVQRLQLLVEHRRADDVLRGRWRCRRPSACGSGGSRAPGRASAPRRRPRSVFGVGVGVGVRVGGGSSSRFGAAAAAGERDRERPRRSILARKRVQATAYSPAPSSSSSCTCSKRLCASAAVRADRGQPDAAELVDRAEHVEDDAAAVRRQPRERGEPQQAAVAERPQPRRLEVVGRHVVPRRAARGGEDRGVGVVDAAGEQLERRQRVRRAAAAQVDLDRVRVPDAVLVARDDEVDSRTAPRAGLGQ